MKIEENILDDDFHIETRDHYSSAISILEFLSTLGTVYEHKNEYLSDGPRTKTEIEAEVIKIIDKFSRLTISVYINGESNGVHFLHIKISGSLVTEIREEEGIFTNSFHSFYMTSLLPSTRKSAEFDIKKMAKEIEKFINSNKELSL